MRRVLLPILLAFSSLVSSADTSLLMTYDQLGEQADVAGDRERAYFWYTLGMHSHPSFYECRFVRWGFKSPEQLQEKLDARRSMPSGKRWSRLCGPGSLVYVFAEEGLGDTIQFSRYLKALQRDGYQVVFRPQRPVAKLCAQSYPQVIIDTESSEADIPYDSYVPLLSLMHEYRGSIEGAEGYLVADPDRVEEYRARFFTGEELKVGIVWQGFAQRFNDANRSLRLEDLLPIQDIPGVKLYSLQVGYGSEQLEGTGIVDLGATFTDMADTAAAVENLDLLISVDTSVCHLGGALGKPTWTLLPFFSDWRWFYDGDDTPWYGSMRLFRQEVVGDWESVIKRVKVEVECLSET